MVEEYLDLMRETAIARKITSYMILVTAAEIEPMKHWCKQNHAHYNYNYSSHDRIDFYYEITFLPPH